jgi:hypothetical protein
MAVKAVKSLIKALKFLGKVRYYGDNFRAATGKPAGKN